MYLVMGAPRSSLNIYIFIETFKMPKKTEYLVLGINGGECEPASKGQFRGLKAEFSCVMSLSR